MCVCFLKSLYPGEENKKKSIEREREKERERGWRKGFRLEVCARRFSALDVEISLPSSRKWQIENQTNFVWDLLRVDIQKFACSHPKKKKGPALPGWEGRCRPIMLEEATLYLK